MLVSVAVGGAGPIGLLGADGRVHVGAAAVAGGGAG
jgi:hypothetical protein